MENAMLSASILHRHHSGEFIPGTPEGIRTPDPLLRREVLYPAELLAHMH